jgi:hypothetical protein
MRRGVPAEGWTLAVVFLESWAREGRPDLGTAALDAHKVCFPFLGNERSARNSAAMRRGEFVQPPSMSAFFATAFEMVVVNDREGARRALARFRTADHAVGLARCFVAGALVGTPQVAASLGKSIASITHEGRSAAALGGWLALLAHYFLRGATAREAFHAANAVADASPFFSPISEASKMAEHNALPVGMDREFVPCSEVARVVGLAALDRLPVGGCDNDEIRPIVLPLRSREGVAIPDAQQERIEAAVAAALAAGIIPA